MIDHDVTGAVLERSPEAAARDAARDRPSVAPSRTAASRLPAAPSWTAPPGQGPSADLRPTYACPLPAGRWQEIVDERPRAAAMVRLAVWWQRLGLGPVPASTMAEAPGCFQQRRRKAARQNPAKNARALAWATRAEADHPVLLELCELGYRPTPHAPTAVDPGEVTASFWRVIAGRLYACPHLAEEFGRRAATLGLLDPAEWAQDFAQCCPAHAARPARVPLHDEDAPAAAPCRPWVPITRPREEA